jgi:hypothetical protein
VVPCTIATALALRRGTPVATKAMYGVVGWFALVPPSVAVMEVPQRGRRVGAAAEAPLEGVGRVRGYGGGR